MYVNKFEYILIVKLDREASDTKTKRETWPDFLSDGRRYFPRGRRPHHPLLALWSLFSQQAAINANKGGSQYRFTIPTLSEIVTKHLNR